MLYESRFSQRAQWAGGQPISRLMHLALAQPELISLAAGFVDQHALPYQEAAAAIESVLKDPVRARAALQYGTTSGYPPLREAILERQLAADHRSRAESNITLDRVILTAGSNELLHLICEALVEPGDIVLCAAPTYFVFLGILVNHGARSIGVACDEDGIIPAALDETLTKLEQAGDLDRVKAIYLTTYFDNPSSVTLSAARRPEIVALAERWSHRGKIYVIEDAAYRNLRYEGKDLASLHSYDESGGTVISAGTFSKSYAPGIRVGWGIVPAELALPIHDIKGNIDFGSANLNQQIMHEVLTTGGLEPHVAKLQASYCAKRDATLAACDEFLAPLEGVSWHRPTGGLYVWLQLPEHLDAGLSGSLFQDAMDEKMLYVPGEYCYPRESPTPGRNMIRLCFGVQSPANIRRGVAALGRAIQKHI